MPPHLKFDYSKTKRAFEVKYKTSFLVIQGLLFRHTKQTSKNVADTTFKGGKSILYYQYLWGRYPKLGEQSRITYAVATIFIFARLVKDILGVIIFL